MIREQLDPVGELALRRVDATVQRVADEPDALVVGEPVALLLGGDQARHEVVTEVVAPLGHELLHVLVELHRRYGCVLQMGGSDQWGNIVSGIDLGRRLHNAQFFALTAPLITTSSGAKMGKTASGAVWLNADQVSPYEYWQYWRNTDDADVVRFLKLFTVLPLDEIERLSALKGSEINDAKKVLATEATTLVHGRPAAEEAAATARTTFEEGGVGATLPSIDVPRAELENGISVLSAFVRAGLAASNGEVRRAIANNAILVNDARITTEKAVLGEADVTADGVVKLSLGRKRHVLLKPV